MIKCSHKNSLKIQKKNEGLKMDTSNKLIIHRSEARKTQQQVADMLNISKSTYRRMERGEAIPDLEQIKKIADFYDIPEEEFYNTSFPIVHTVSYSQGLLDDFRKLIAENEEITDDWKTNHFRFKKLQEGFEKVWEEKAKALEFPHLNLESIPTGTTVKRVNLDIEGEELMDYCLKVQKALGKALFS